MNGSIDGHEIWWKESWIQECGNGNGLQSHILTVTLMNLNEKYVTTHT